MFIIGKQYFASRKDRTANQDIIIRKGAIKELRVKEDGSITYYGKFLGGIEFNSDTHHICETQQKAVDYAKES